MRTPTRRLLTLGLAGIVSLAAGVANAEQIGSPTCDRVVEAVQKLKIQFSPDEIVVTTAKGGLASDRLVILAPQAKVRIEISTKPARVNGNEIPFLMRSAPIEELDIAKAVFQNQIEVARRKGKNVAVDFANVVGKDRCMYTDRTWREAFAMSPAQDLYKLISIVD